MKNKTIAVLPFVNMSSNIENEYFSDGITEEIINALAKIDQLRVTSRTSSFFFKNKNIPIGEIGKSLGVNTLLEGSVRLSGNAMRVTAQLIDATNDYHFWSETWDRKLDNIFEVQDEISLLIADKLREQFGHFEIQEHLVEKKTESLDAYTYFLKGRHHFHKWNPDDVKVSIGFYEKALDLDPNHTEAMVGLADAYSFLATIAVISFEEGWGKCAELTHKALSINYELPAAHYQLANLAFFTACNYLESFQHAKKAIELNSNHIESQQFMAFLYIVAGKNADAKKHLEIALSLDPLSQETQFYNGFIKYMLEDYEQSIIQLDACLKVNPLNIPVHSVKSMCLIMLGKYKEASHYFDSLPSEIVIESEKTGIQTIAYSKLGNLEKSEESLKQLKEQSLGENGFTADSYLFLLAGILKQNEIVFTWLEEALKKGSPLLLLRYSDPMVNPIKSDSRYRDYYEKLFPSTLFQKGENSTKKKAPFDSETVLKVKNQIIELFESEKPFIDPELSLRSLAKQLNIHHNHLSWLLNDGFSKNFNEFVNQYRIGHFKTIAKEPGNAKLTIMALAFDSGFNSKTVFNSYFKKETGQTPKEFLKG